jgi:hypothetical protein
MKYLEFIDDDKLIEAVSFVVDSINKTKQTPSDLGRNSLDPFGAIFECSDGTDYQEWKNRELARQNQKTMQNNIGAFHEKLIAGIPGCEKLEKGMDILCVNQSWFAEIKNKFNTTKGNYKPKLYDDIESWCKRFSQKYSKQFTGYYVYIIPNRPEKIDKPFTPAHEGKRRPHNEYIREITVSFLYEKITGNPNAFFEVYNVLPDVLEKEFGLKVGLEKNIMKDLFLSNIYTNSIN